MIAEVVDNDRITLRRQVSGVTQSVDGRSNELSARKCREDHAESERAKSS
jgi:hypothetical protein